MFRTKRKIKSSVDIHRRPKNLKIFKFTKLINPDYIYIGDNVIIDDFCFIYAKQDAPIKIGSWVHIANFSTLTGGPITLGNFVGISGGCRILGGTEDYKNGALMNPPIPEKYRNINRNGCIIEDFCFLGANSCVFPGITIKEGAIVGTGSIIRDNLEPWGIYVMKNGKMIKIKDRDKQKTYETAKKLSQEFANIRLLSILNDI